MHAPPRLRQRCAPLIPGLAMALALMPPRPVSTGSPPPVPAAAITTLPGFGLAGSAVYVSSSSGLYRSTSADYSRWTRQNTWPDIKLISPDPRHPDTLACATGGDLYHSTDAGVTATKVKACGLATGTFIPASAHLRAVPGYIVPSYFWRYMSDARDAPDGWFRDFGLPLGKAVTATVTKGQLGPRSVVIQAFQNAILTYDDQNPQPWRVERANVGQDYAATFPQAVR